MISKEILQKHFFSFVHKIGMEASIPLDGTESSRFFVAETPSTPIDPKNLEQDYSILKQFRIDSIPAPNCAIFQQHPNRKTYKDMLYDVLCNIEHKGAKPSNDPNTNKLKPDEIQQRLREFHSEEQDLSKQISLLRQKPPDEELADLEDRLKKLKQDKLQFISQYYEILVVSSRTQLARRKMENPHDKSPFMPFVLTPKECQKFFSPGDDGTYKGQGFCTTTYDSRTDALPALDEERARLMKSLSADLLGQLDKLPQIPLEQQSHLEISCEWQTIEVGRDQWFVESLLSCQRLGHKDNQKHSWSNGTIHSQASDAKLPYISRSIVIVRNIRISGFSPATLDQLAHLDQKTDLHVFQFQLQRGFELECKQIEESQLDEEAHQELGSASSDGDEFQAVHQQRDIKPPCEAFEVNQQDGYLQLNAPRVFGYIIEPLPAFPPFSSEKFKGSLNYFPSTSRELRHEDDFSVTDCSNKSQDFWPEGSEIRVRFVDTPSEPLLKLYERCVHEWTRIVPLKVTLDQEATIPDDDDYTLLSVKVDASGFSYTVGLGPGLKTIRDLSGFNQKLGHPVFSKLAEKTASPEIEEKCRGIIMHQLGFVFGLHRELVSHSDLQFDQEQVMDFFRRFLIYQANENNDVHVDVEKKAQELAANYVLELQPRPNFGDKPDSSSIMFYPIPKSWVRTPEDYQPNFNSQLSTEDMENITTHYQRARERLKTERLNNAQTVEFEDLDGLIEKAKEVQVKNRPRYPDPLPPGPLLKDEKEEEKVQHPVIDEKAEEAVVDGPQQEEPQIPALTDKKKLDQSVLDLRADLEDMLAEGIEPSQLISDYKDQIAHLQDGEEQLMNFINQLKPQEPDADDKPSEIVEEKAASEESDADDKPFDQNIERIKGDLEEMADEMNTLEEFLQTYEEDTDATASKDWKEQLASIFYEKKDLIHPRIEAERESVFSALPDLTLEDLLVRLSQEAEIIRIRKWRRQVQKLFDQEQNKKPAEVFSQAELIPLVKLTWDQREVLLKKLEKADVRDQIGDKVLERVYKGLTLVQVHDYRDFYAKYNGCITNKVDHILNEERPKLSERFTGNAEPDFEAISKETRIIPEVLQKIYEREFAQPQDSLQQNTESPRLGTVTGSQDQGKDSQRIGTVQTPGGVSQNDDQLMADIKFYLLNDFTKEQIIVEYEKDHKDMEGWRDHLIGKIDQVYDECVKLGLLVPWDTKLPVLNDEQKQLLKERFRNNGASQIDENMPVAIFGKKFPGLEKVTVTTYKNYYMRNSAIINCEDQLSKQEKTELWQNISSRGDGEPNLKEVAEQTFVHLKLLTTIYEREIAKFPDDCELIQIFKKYLDKSIEPRQIARRLVNHDESLILKLEEIFRFNEADYELIAGYFNQAKFLQKNKVTLFLSLFDHDKAPQEARQMMEEMMPKDPIFVCNLLFKLNDGFEHREKLNNLEESNPMSAQLIQEAFQEKFTLWMGDIGNLKEDKIRRLFGKYEHCIDEVRINKKNIAYLDFSSSEILEAIFNQFNGKPMDTEGKMFFNLRKNFTIRVERIDSSLSQEKFEKIFKDKFPSVFSANIVNRVVKDKVHGYVQFSNKEEYDQALKTNIKISGTKIKLMPLIKRQQRKGSDNNNQINDSNHMVIQCYKDKNPIRVIQRANIINMFHNAESYEQKIAWAKAYEERRLFETATKAQIDNFSIDFTEIDRDGTKIQADKQQKFNELIKKQYKNLRLLESDYQFCKEYLKLHEVLWKSLDDWGIKTTDDQQPGLITRDHIEKLATDLETPIVLHQLPDLNHFDKQTSLIGSDYLQDEDHIAFKAPIRIVFDEPNQSFALLFLKYNNKFNIKGINAEMFKGRYEEVFGWLDPWMQEFFGLKCLFSFIFDEKENRYYNQNIKVLDKLAKSYQQYLEDQNHDLLASAQKDCQELERKSPLLFNDWYRRLIISQGKPQKIFKEEYDFLRSRTKPQELVNLQCKLKSLLPNLDYLYTLADFNQISANETENQRINKFKNIIKAEDKKQFSLLLITAMHGAINRRENISKLVEVIYQIEENLKLSTRFLIAFVMQQSDMALRSRILYYQSQFFAVPLIMPCQASYNSGAQLTRYVPEIAFNMMEGFGIFSFGVGFRSQNQCGKTSLLNDFIFSATEANHQPFSEDDPSPFSSGQVDVFFEKKFNIKRNMVIMDGQGFLKKETIKSCLLLTNVVLITVSRQDLLDKAQFLIIQEHLDLVKQQTRQQNIKVILLVRDSQSRNIAKEGPGQPLQLEKNHEREPIEKLSESFDYCVQIHNMKNQEKSKKLNQMVPIFKVLNKIIDGLKDKAANEKQWRFTKEVFIKDFLSDQNLIDEQERKNSAVISEVDKNVREFLAIVDTIKKNIFTARGFPLLKLKAELRQAIIAIRKHAESDNQDEKRLNTFISDIDNLKKQIKALKPTDIIKKFYDIVTHLHAPLILTEIASHLRNITAEQLIEPNQKLQKILKEYDQQMKDNKITDEVLKKQQNDKILKNHKAKLEEISKEKFEKSISLEYLWRNMIHYMSGKESDIMDFNTGSTKVTIVEQIDSLMKMGDCFELIDGENLEFKGLFIKEVIKQTKRDKVIVVCVVGPQSSGKSTLMNYAFGTQFFTSVGRCTSGIYFTLQKIPDHMKDNKAGVKWLLMLDTEGLQSPERADSEYDRKIVLFAMLSADLLIINNKGEINPQMKETLEISTRSFDLINPHGKKPCILYTFGQNPDTDNKAPFINQVKDIKDKVIEATESETIAENANAIFGNVEERIHLFGYAFTELTIEGNQERCQYSDFKYTKNQQQFGKETSSLFAFVQEHLNKDTFAVNSPFSEFQAWLDDANANWNTIDKHSSDINRFKDLQEFRNDALVSNAIHKLWDDYLEGQKIKQTDETDIEKHKINLTEMFKRKGEKEAKKELDNLTDQNNERKDANFKKYIEEKFNTWKLAPKNRDSVTVRSEQTHMAAVRAKNVVLKNEFSVMLRAHISDEKIGHVNQFGHRQVVLAAMDLAGNADFLKLKAEGKQKEVEDLIESTFQVAWKESLKNISIDDQREQIKEVYFSDLLKVFRGQNHFIQHVNKNEYKELSNKIDKIVAVEDKKTQQHELESFLVNTFTEEDTPLSLFNFDNDMLVQMRDNPALRFYNDKELPESFLKLRRRINCDYNYVIIKDLAQEIDKKMLEQELIKNMTKTKHESDYITKYNYYGHKYQERYTYEAWDVAHQQGYLRNIITYLEDAGFGINCVIGKKIKLCQISDQIKVEKIFTSFKTGYSHSLEGSRQKRIKWIKDFVQWLEFDPQLFKELNQELQMFFKSEKVDILDREDPFETFEFHSANTKEGEKLKASVIRNTAKITYKLQKKAAREISQVSFKFLLYPRDSDASAVTRQKHLSDIAHSEIQWWDLARRVITEVQSITKTKFGEFSTIAIAQEQHEGGVAPQQVSQENQNTAMSHQNVKFLVQNILENKIMSALQKELHQKMGLHLKPTTKAKIINGAMHTCWLEQYMRAKSLYKSTSEDLAKEENNFRGYFRQIIDGNTSKVTLQNSREKMKAAFKAYRQLVQQHYKAQLIEHLNKVKHHFDTKKVYDSLDDTYVKKWNTQGKLQKDQFIKYCTDPVAIFTENANELKRIYIDDEIVKLGNKAKKDIEKQMRKLLDIVVVIRDALKDVSDKAKGIENYFRMFPVNNDLIEPKEIELNERTQLMNQLSPAIHKILNKIIKGEFKVGQPGQFTCSLLKKNQGADAEIYLDKKYSFLPIESLIDSPLPKLVELSVKAEIQAAWSKKIETEMSKDFSVAFAEKLEQEWHDKVLPLLQIDQVFDGFKQELDDQMKIEEGLTLRDAFFDCNTMIDELHRSAIGCINTCLFCKRKCELPHHDAQQLKHNCDTVGHQLRVFAGGKFENQKTNQKYPSLLTCDLIDQNKPMLYNGQKLMWREIITTQMSPQNWRVNYQINVDGIIKKKENFEKFWTYMGEQFLKDNYPDFIYVAKSDEVEKSGGLMSEKGVVVLCIDESGSMRGPRWNNAVAGVKKMIGDLTLRHANPLDISFVLTYFGSYSREIWKGDLSQSIPEEKWAQGGGGTEFGPPLEMAFDNLKNYIAGKDFAKIGFFTDGSASYPEAAMQNIENLVNNRRSTYLRTDNSCKLSITLVTDYKDSQNLKAINNRFNKIGRDKLSVGSDICQIITEVKTEDLGNILIESFDIK